MTIRPAVPGDLDAILVLERGLPTAPHWPAEAYRTALAGDTRVLLVAEEEAVLVGFVAIRRLDAEAELESVAVLASSQGQGIGLALVRAGLHRAETEGARTMLLEVRRGSQRAQAVYRRAGFREYATRPGYYLDPAEDAILMRWCATPEKLLAGRNEGEV